MTKKRKLILSSGLLVSATLATLAVSCGSEAEAPTTPSTPRRKDRVLSGAVVHTLDELINPKKTFRSGLGSLDKLAKQRFYKSNINATYTLSAIPFDQSYSFGAGNSAAANSTVIKLVGITNRGESLYENVRNRNTETGAVLEGSTTRVIRPTVWNYSLNGADQVILELNDGSTKIFASDDADIVPRATIENKYYSTAYQQLKSSNPNSINSFEFEEALKETKKLSYRVRENVAWINNEGKNSGFNLTGNDFYIGYIRTRLYDTKYRHANGGSKELDDAARSLSQDPLRSWGSSNNYANEYLLNLYGVDRDGVLNRQNFITQSSNRDFVNFSEIPNTSAKDFLSMFEYVATSNEWVPAPSGYIKSRNDANNEVILSQKVEQKAEEVNKIATEIKKASSLAREAGYYWYGTNFGNTLYAGKYYYNSFNSTTLSEIMLKNDLYWDKNFVDSKNNLLRIETEYQREKLDESQYTTRIFDLYQAGDVSNINFRTQTTKNQSTIRSNPLDFGLTFSQDLNKKSFTRNIVWNIVPQVSSAGNQNSSRTNAAFEKLIWNSDASNKISDGSLIAGDVLKNSTSKFGLAFRSIVSAAINWNKVVNIQSLAGQRIPWYSGLAPDANIGGSDHSTSTTKTPREAYSNLNKLFAVDLQGSKINLGEKNVNNEVTTEANRALDIGTGSDDSVKSAAYAELKNAMKTLLDEFFRLNPSLSEQKIEFGIDNRFTNTSANDLMAIKDTIKIINELDSRLNANLIEGKDNKLWSVNWLSGRKAFALNGWGYDYDGIGSGFDALSWNQSGSFIPVLGLILTDQEYRTAISKSFPAIVRAADRFDAYIRAQKPGYLTIPMTEWFKMSVKDFYSLSNNLGTNTYDNGKYVLITDKTKLSQEGGVISSTFWLFFQLESTNEQLIELGKEIATFFGVTPNSAISIAENNFSEVVSNPNYIAPVSLGNWSSLSDINVAAEAPKPVENPESKPSPTT